MACTLNTSSNTNTENNGTQLPVHLQRKKTRRCAHYIHIRKTLKQIERSSRCTVT